MHEAWEFSKCFDCFYFVLQEEFDNRVVITSTPNKLMEASESVSLNEAQEIVPNQSEESHVGSDGPIYQNLVNPSCFATVSEINSM